MGLKAAKEKDHIEGVDQHAITEASGTPAVGIYDVSIALSDNLSSNVYIDGLPAATFSSKAIGTAPTLDTPTPNHKIQDSSPKGAMVTPPTNQAEITGGSQTVFINELKAARDGDTATSCKNAVLSTASVSVAQSSVYIGG